MKINQTLKPKRSFSSGIFRGTKSPGKNPVFKEPFRGSPPFLRRKNANMEESEVFAVKAADTAQEAIKEGMALEKAIATVKTL